MLEFNQIDHLNLTVKNLDKSVNFYKKVFNFDVHEEGNFNGTPFKIIGISQKAMLCLYENKNLENKKSNINHIGFNIDFYENIVEDLENLNVKLEYYNGKAIIQYPMSRSIYIHDPDGNEIELSSKLAGGL